MNKLALPQKEISLEEPFLLMKPDLSEEAYLSLVNEDSHTELMEGELIMHSPASAHHEDLFRFLIILLGSYVSHKQLGKVLGSRFPVRLKPKTLPEPELIFVSSSNLKHIQSHYYDGAPDFVLEIFSPSTRVYDRTTKRQLYQEAGVSEIWLIDPDEEEVHADVLTPKGTYRSQHLSGGKLRASAIPGFWIDVAWLWQKPLPGEYPLLQRLLGEKS